MPRHRVFRPAPPRTDRLSGGRNRTNGPLLTQPSAFFRRKSTSRESVSREFSRNSDDSQRTVVVDSTSSNTVDQQMRRAWRAPSVPDTNFGTGIPTSNGTSNGTNTNAPFNVNSNGNATHIDYTNSTVSEALVLSPENASDRRVQGSLDVPVVDTVSVTETKVATQKDCKDGTNGSNDGTCVMC